MNRIKALKHEKKIYGMDTKISSEEIEKLDSGMPIQRILGFINFDNLRIELDDSSLIPRYETEEVVAEALKYINGGSKVLDLGCGSGYIGLTIKQKTNANVLMSDISKKSVELSKKNAINNKLKVQVIESNLFENINEKFDVIISNPPYIPLETKLDESVILFEPSHALFGGKDGNYFYKMIINEVENYLNKNGILIFEISPFNVAYVKAKGFKILKDINGKERIAIKKY